MTDWTFPKALYADGGDELIWGKPVRTLIVQSADEEVEALADGWRLHPIADDPMITAEVVEPQRPQLRARKVDS